MSIKVGYSLSELTKAYVKAFHDRNLDAVGKFFSEKFKLTDPNICTEGAEESLKYIESFFSGINSLNFNAKRILVVDDYNSVIEFELVIDEKKFLGVDIIHWDDVGKMLSMDAYLYEKIL